jgi:hypothetical protein
MTIQWFGKHPDEGTASLYSTNITLNTVAGQQLISAYKVQVGVDENKNVVIRPLSKNQVERGDIPTDIVFSFQCKKTYSRICSCSLMKNIEQACGITLSSDPQKFNTRWNNDEGFLIIETSVKGGN